MGLSGICLVLAVPIRQGFSFPSSLFGMLVAVALQGDWRVMHLAGSKLIVNHSVCRASLPAVAALQPSAASAGPIVVALARLALLAGPALQHRAERREVAGKPRCSSQASAVSHQCVTPEVILWCLSHRQGLITPWDHAHDARHQL